MAVIPTVIERHGRGERASDIYSRLLRDHIIFLGSAIDEDIANLVIAQMLFCAGENPDRAIRLYINSPGGSVPAGLSIFDTMQTMPNPIETICLGQAFSMGAVLLAGGTKGERRALPHARVMLHQPSGGAGGQASDIERHASEVLKLRDQLNRIIADCTDQSIETVERDADRDFFMSADEAVAYGLVDEVFSISARQEENP